MKTKLGLEVDNLWYNTSTRYWKRADVSSSNSVDASQRVGTKLIPLQQVNLTRGEKS
jgi:hypothetical protein